MESIMLSADETAQYLNLTKARIMYLARENKVPAVKFGKHWCVHREKLDKLIQQKLSFCSDLETERETVFMTVEETIKYLNINIKSSDITDLARRRQIPALKFDGKGKLWRIHKGKLDALLEKNPSFFEKYIR